MEQVNVETQGGKPVTELKTLAGPLTLRDVIVVAGAVLVLVGSLIPMPWTKTANVNLWIFPGLPFQLFVSLILPLGVGAAFAWRRLTGRTRVRVGSLSLDQFGSVTALIAGAFFFNSYAATMSPAYLLGLLGSFAMIFGTTLARYFEFMRRDFHPGNPSVITEDVHPVAGATLKNSATANSSTSTESAPVGDADEVFGARQNADGPRPVPHAPREENSPVAPAASTKAGVAAVVVGAALDQAAPTDETKTESGLEAGTDETTKPSDLEKAVSPALAVSEEPKKSDAVDADAADKPEARQNPENIEQVQSSKEALPGAETLEEAATKPSENSAIPTDEPVENPAGSKETQGALAHSPEAQSDDVAIAGKAADQGAMQHESNSTTGANPRAASVDTADKPQSNDQETASAANHAATSSTFTESAKTEFPAATLGQDEAEKPENTIAGTGLIPATTEAQSAEMKPAHQTSMQEAAPVDATAAIPAATPAPNATAALSREEISAQMAQAASHREAAESSFGARADLEPAESEPKSFWFALNQPRDVFDPRGGSKVTTLQPGVWILCLEDRGQDYLISLDGGRKAVLRDLDNLQFPEN